VADVLLYDLRGHGLSERPKSGYDLDQMVADLAGLLDAMAISRPVTLIGNSFGGLLAVAFALKHPARTAGLVLVDGHLGDDGFARQMAGTLRLTGEERDSKIAESFKHWLGRHSARKANKLADNARALVEGTTLVDDMARTPTLTASDLAKLDTRVLALYGEHSDLRAMAEATLAGVPNVQIEIMSGCTHSIIWEATVAVRERIIGFLAGQRP
jgi:pimeloyl-ACP methyl ester carboxylesterase